MTILDVVTPTITKYTMDILTFQVSIRIILQIIKYTFLQIRVISILF